METQPDRLQEDGAYLEQMDPEQKTKLINRTFILTYLWLGLHIWMTILGGIVKSMYSVRIKTNSWW